MDQTFKNLLWWQFGAAIDMLENALVACPEKLWSDGTSHNEFWYINFHTLFWLDLYLGDSLTDFVPPAPFGLTELDRAGVLPERVYSKPELLKYLEHCREKCHAKIKNLTGEKANEIILGFGWTDRTVLELLMYNMRHVSHHAGQLCLMLRQQSNTAPKWLVRTKHQLEQN